MSNVALFAIGVAVTLLVTPTLALLVWGAVLDGRYERARVEHEREVAAQRPSDARSVVDAP